MQTELISKITNEKKEKALFSVLNISKNVGRRGVKRSLECDNGERGVKNAPKCYKVIHGWSLTFIPFANIAITPLFPRMPPPFSGTTKACKLSNLDFIEVP